MWYLALILFGIIQKSLLGISTAWPLPHSDGYGNLQRGCLCGPASVGLPGGGFGPSNSEVPALCPGTIWMQGCCLVAMAVTRSG